MLGTEVGPAHTYFGRIITGGNMSKSGKLNPAYKHGAALRGNHTPEYKTWTAMIDRCYVKSSSTYKKYGAKGIGVCDSWRHSFANFLSDMGEKPGVGYSIDRIDNAQGYSPDNCRWATSMEQGSNQTSNVVVSFRGENYTVSQLMRHLGIYTKSGKYYGRLTRGWSVERAFLTE